MHSACFLAGAADPACLPKPKYPEIAFAGRSNVGKSSLLNCLVGQHKLARVSKTPGRTQQINFFLIDEQLLFVDLPGYGFARVPPSAQQRWKHLVETYLRTRRNLRAVAVIVDLRRGIEADDAQLLDYLRVHRIPAILVATKADKLAYGARQRRVRQVTEEVRPDVALVVTSAASGDGIGQLWRKITLAVQEARRSQAPR